MNNIKYLNKILKIKIDRPMGSKHPKHGFIYPVNYGYVPNTISGDGEELDAYVLGIYEPLETFTGECIAIIHRTNDNDDKLVIVPDNKTFTNEEIKVLTDFQEQYFKSIILRPDDYATYGFRYTYNKLVRDMIPENIDNEPGRKSKYRILDDKEYLIELNKKVIEEANEFVENNSIEELGDLIEVINAIMKLKSYKMEDVYKVMKEKTDKKGAFNNRIYLEYVDEEKRNLEEEKELNKDFRKI